MNTDKGKGYLGIDITDFCKSRNVSIMFSSGALGPREHEEVFWDVCEK